MPTEARKPLIVISYAHADEPEKPADAGGGGTHVCAGLRRP
jgi:hypothetical protein